MARGAPLGSWEWRVHTHGVHVMLTGATLFVCGSFVPLCGGQLGMWLAGSVLTAAGTSTLSALAYGESYVQEAVLYHLFRVDNRHNYSLWWLVMYLTYDSPHRRLLGLATFLPQCIAQVAVVWTLQTDLVLTAFAQTVVFVHANKVITAQYFVWYLIFVPVLAPRLRMPKRTALVLTARWLGSMLLWLGVAYLLEFQGAPTMLLLWAASILFFGVSMHVLTRVIQQCGPPVGVEKGSSAGSFLNTGEGAKREDGTNTAGRHKVHGD